MTHLVAHSIEKAFGDRRVLIDASLTLTDRDRVGLVGANGSGKSTFVRCLVGTIEVDHGDVRREGSLAMLDQEPRLPGSTVGEAADQAVEWHARLLAAYQAALDAGDVDGAAAIQDKLDQVGWEVAHKVDAVLDRLGCPPRDAEIERLSGGERRRVALARALLEQPDVLVLDEPTNHLDADTVEWLQAFLTGYRGAVLLVTHDRYLLEAVANRIVEIEDGKTITYDDCSYTDYLLERAERRASALKADAARMNLIRREAEWAARSPAARTTKQVARLKRLDALKSQEGVTQERSFELDLRSGRRLGSTIIELHDLSKGFDDRVLIDDLSVSLGPGDRLGILGPNGAGKTTLLELVRGRLHPDKGQVVRGSRVRIGILDQHRTGLVDEQTLFESVGRGNDRVKVGENYVHVATFLQRFLFGREMLDQHVGALSGGERARLLLAKLLLTGSNVLLLDEPTNDLDLLTLRVLEEALLSFDGCALVVTHDRAFLDRVCTGMLAFEGDGRVTRYADRMQHQRALEARRAAQRQAAEPKVRDKPVQTGPSAAERREMKELPERIERLEVRQAELEQLLSEPSVYEDGGERARELTHELEGVNAQIEVAYARWAELDG